MVICGLIFLMFRVRKRAPIVSLGIGWFFLSLLPVMEFIPQGSMMNERSAYISSFGWAIILAWGIAWMNHRWKKGAIWCALGILAFYGVQTFSRNRDWKNDETLWQADIRVSPNENAYAYFALGNAYNDQKCTNEREMPIPRLCDKPRVCSRMGKFRKNIGRHG